MSFYNQAYNYINKLSPCNKELSEAGFSVLITNNKQIAFHLAEVNKSIALLPNTMALIVDKYNNDGIKLINVWSDVWDTKPEIIKSRISAMCGVFDRIHGRETEVVGLSQIELNDFLSANHLQGSTVAKYRYGLTYKGNLVAAASFAAFRVFKKPQGEVKSAELIRYAGLNGFRVAGGLSKLLAHFTAAHKPDDIMTYADRDWSDGAGYKQLGFAAESITSPQKFLIHPTDNIRYSVQKPPQKYIGIENPQESMLNEGYVEIYNCGSIKYKKYLNPYILH